MFVCMYVYMYVFDIIEGTGSISNYTNELEGGFLHMWVWIIRNYK